MSRPQTRPPRRRGRPARVPKPRAGLVREPLATSADPVAELAARATRADIAVLHRIGADPARPGVGRDVPWPSLLASEALASVIRAAGGAREAILSTDLATETSPALRSVAAMLRCRSIAVVPVLQDDGAVVGALVVASHQPRRWTPGDRRALELLAGMAAAESEQARASAERARTLEALSRVTGEIAHDFKGYLAVLLANAEHLHARLAPDDPDREAVLDIVEASRSGELLARQLLTFARRHRMQRLRLDLALLVRRSARLVAPLVGAATQLEVGGQARDLWIAADASALERVVMNLVTNANDAMPSGGTIRISAFSLHLERSSPHQHGIVSPGHWAVLVVQDEGSGMSKETLARLFEPFYTTKAGSGTGLGLSAVYGIVTQLEGHVVVESREGTGSSFTIYLPLADAPPSPTV